MKWRHLVGIFALIALGGCHLTLRDNGGGGNGAGRAFATLHRFSGNAGGNFPNGVIVDANGVIFGTTQGGGNCASCGVIFRLKQTGSGRWSYTVLHRFVTSKGGIKPLGRLALHDSKLYGTASAGGDPACNCGVVFRINTDGSGFAVVHTFKTGAQGATPTGGVLIDTDGTIYGTTAAGGANGAGVVFRIAPGGAFAVLHDFLGLAGSGPKGELIFGADGAIYGTQFGGGAFNRGTIFRITKAGAYTVLHDFAGFQNSQNTDGASPDGALALGSDETIYGTTSTGGNVNFGTAWSIKPNGSAYRQLHSFVSGEATVPHSGLTIGTDDTLYGAGASGGANGDGALFSLKPGGRYATLRSFNASTSGGDSPQSPLALSSDTLYGTTLVGGNPSSTTCSGGCGTVFSFKP
jgi:uncharacterized repeat protein (TIGR03803 family)